MFILCSFIIIPVIGIICKYVRLWLILSLNFIVGLVLIYVL